MINYTELLKTEIKGLLGDMTAKVSQINRYYEIYEGKQEWDVPGKLDYQPTKKITNKIRNLINKRARFMFGENLYFNFKPILMPITNENREVVIKENEVKKAKAQEKENIFANILKENKFHTKILKARKDCSIGGKIAIKLWAKEGEGLKIIFCPAQEFFVEYDTDDIDNLQKVVFLYALNDEKRAEDQRINKQVWELREGKCILNETIYDGKGEVISEEWVNHNTKLDFIPVLVITNGGLTGEVEGKSDIDLLWPNADQYNKLTSDDIDALKFQMFGQDVFIDAAESSLENLKIAPGAVIDLQTSSDIEGRQARGERLESTFSYKEKFEDTINRLNNDMHDSLSVPNVGLEQLKGLMQSGKSMKALYWDLISACEEDFATWTPALEQMAEYIWKMVEIYNLYDAKELAKVETNLSVEHYYPIPEDEDDKQRLDLDKVVAGTMSRLDYIKKWIETDDPESYLEQLIKEKQMFEDSYTKSLEDDLGDDE